MSYDAENPKYPKNNRANFFSGAISASDALVWTPGKIKREDQVAEVIYLEIQIRSNATGNWIFGILRDLFQRNITVSDLTPLLPTDGEVIDSDESAGDKMHLLYTTRASATIEFAKTIVINRPFFVYKELIFLLSHTAGQLEYEVNIVYNIRKKENIPILVQFINDNWENLSSQQRMRYIVGGTGEELVSLFA